MWSLLKNRNKIRYRIFQLSLRPPHRSGPGPEGVAHGGLHPDVRTRVRRADRRLLDGGHVEVELRLLLQDAAQAPIRNLGCLRICLWLDGEGGSFCRQPASMPFLQQNLQIFSKDLKYISKILQNTTNLDNHLRFAAIPAKFYENRGENDVFERKFNNFLQKSRKNHKN